MLSPSKSGIHRTFVNLCSLVLILSALIGHSVTGSTILEQQLGPVVTGDGFAGDNFGYALSLYEDTLLIGSPCHSPDGITSPSSGAYIYRRTESGWIEEAKLVDEQGRPNIGLGLEVCLFDERTAFVAKQSSVNGMAYYEVLVFEYNDDIWSLEQRLSRTPECINDGFGISIAANSQFVFIGRPGIIETETGAVHVFTKDDLGQWVEVQVLVPTDAEIGDRTGMRVCASENTLLSMSYASEVDNSSAVYVYHFQGDRWVEAQKLLAPDEKAWDEFGWSMNLETDQRAIISAPIIPAVYIMNRTDGIWTVDSKVIGASGTDTDRARSVDLSGSVALKGIAGESYLTIHEEEDGLWTETQGISLNDPQGELAFGWSLEFNGNEIFVGSRRNQYDGTTDGIVYRLIPGAEGWELADAFTAGRTGDSATNREFGDVLAISTDRAILGVKRYHSEGLETGAAHILKKGIDGWQPEVTLRPDGLEANDRFGQSVDICGNTSAIGAPGDDDLGSSSGSVYIYLNSGNDWLYETKLSASDGSETILFGELIQLDGDTLFVRAGNWSDRAVYVFSRAQGDWTEVAKLTPSSGEPSFGHSFSVDGNSALIGAHDVVFAFERENGIWREVQRIEGTWFRPSIVHEGSVALIGDTGDDEGGSFSGAVNVYHKVGGVWEQAEKLTASDAAARAGFGYAVSLTNGLALVTAPGRIDNPGSGRAYLFRFRDGAWEEEAILAECGTERYGHSVALANQSALVGDPLFIGLNLHGEGVANQGAVFAYALFGDEPDGDGDGGSDVWETANGFDPNSPGDFDALDSDDDGLLDLLEIYHGSDKEDPASSAMITVFSADLENGLVRVRYSRDPDASGVRAFPKWSTDLSGWHVPGGQAGGVKVTLFESVLGMQEGLEIVESTAEVKLGTTEKLFIQLDVVPVE